MPNQFRLRGWSHDKQAENEVNFDYDVAVGVERPVDKAHHRQPTVWDDPRVDGTARLMTLYGIARRVYRICIVILVACLLLSLFGLFAPSFIGSAAAIQDKRLYLKLGLYFGLFAFFGWLIVSAGYTMEGLERRSQFKPNLDPWSIRGPEPEAYDAPTPLQPILVIRREGSNAPVPTVAEAAKRHKLVFNLAFAATPALTFLPDALRSGDKLMGLGGLGLWCYFCYVAARDGLYILDTWIDEHLTGPEEHV